jgi:hypothetical protein
MYNITENDFRNNLDGATNHTATSEIPYHSLRLFCFSFRVSVQK